jgi:antitoxin component YwqK of YwqJK toxin-antitoxin module
MSEFNNGFCGVVRTYHDNKKTMLYKEYFINAGKIEGIYKLYWNNGQLLKEENYIDGKKV